MVKQVKVSFPAHDKFVLSGTLYYPEEAYSNQKAVLINSATAVKRSYYKVFARFLATQGFTVLTFDYRGIGDSRPTSLRGFEAFMHQWGEQDVAGAIDWLLEQAAFSQLLVVGHSVGGQMVGLAPNNTKITAMLTIAAQSGYWRLFPFPYQLKLILTWYLFLPFGAWWYGYFPAKKFGFNGEDLPAGVAREWARWNRSRHYISDQAGKPIRRYFESFNQPIQAWSFADDAIAPQKAVDKLMSFYQNAKVERVHLMPQSLGVKTIGHFGFFRIREFENSLWQEVVRWLNSH